MFISDAPKTIKEAKEYRYGSWAGNPKGSQYKEGFCAFEIWERFVNHQCQRKNGYSPEGLYCKQHANMIAERIKHDTVSF